MSQLRAIRGMVDILPDDSPLWQRVEQTARRVLDGYGYREIRLPIIESTELFARSIGEVTDIVEKEMYTFPDRNDESLTLRPEGTAGCVRAAVQHNLIATPQRLWYAGPMFRYERPQKGRQRQFHQLGVEAFGVATPDQDAELLLLAARLWRELGIADALTLELNSIGNPESRARYRDALVGYLEARRDHLDEDSQRRLATNPLRILDSKHPDTQRLLAEAPSLADHLDEESHSDFARLCELLAAAGIEYTLNDRLVRGLDYYNKTVFEWTTDRLGAQGTVCGGGRYDGLVAQFGGRATPAAGFAIGLERLVLMVEAAEAAVIPRIDAYVVAADTAAAAHALPRIEALRDAIPGLAVQQHLGGGGSFKSQFKRADKSGARWALVFGESEVSEDRVTVKPLRGDGEQQTLPIAELKSFMAQIVAARVEE